MRLTLAPAAIAILALAACRSDDEHRSTTTSDTYRADGKPADASGTRSSSMTLSESDRRFLLDAASANQFEIKSSELALEKGVTGEAAQCANAIIADHNKSAQELQSLASRKGITLPRDLQAKHQALLDRLRAASATEFERQYAQIQLDAHREAISAFERASQNADDPDVRSFARRTQPVLEKHEQMLRDKMGRL